jgi:hypothetical protein
VLLGIGLDICASEVKRCCRGCSVYLLQGAAEVVVWMVVVFDLWLVVCTTWYVGVEKHMWKG